MVRFKIGTKAISVSYRRSLPEIVDVDLGLELGFLQRDVDRALACNERGGLDWGPSVYICVVDVRAWYVEGFLLPCT